MLQYHGLIRRILRYGVQKGDRTGTGTISMFGHMSYYDLQDGFPLVTTKKVHMPSIVHELLWFIKGETNIKYLKDNNVRIWNEWADENGDLGPVYGSQWRSWVTYNDFEIEKVKLLEDGGADIDITFNTIDQLQNVIHQIRTNPNSRRLIVTAWNPADVDNMKLPPCHMLFQFYVADGKLSCMLTQRSADVFLGVPFNIASYALLTHMIAHITGYEVGQFIHSLGDAHIYNNHISQVNLQLSRDFRPLPKINVNRHNREIKEIDDFTYDDIELIGYDPHDKIKGDVSV